jgi:transcriptional regulator with XRE-family HTH domain
VRQQQGFTLRRVARQLRVELGEVRRQERPGSNLTLSQLYKWSKVLDLPAGELVDGVEQPLAGAIRERAKMVRIMKTVAALAEQADNDRVKQLAQRMVKRLVQLMPELATVGAWHSVGQRRSMDEYGRAADQPYSSRMWSGDE